MPLKAANISLEGEYTVNIRDRFGNIIRTIGPHKNFITSMGLSYPYTYSFADCFRYLSLGYSGTPNTITGTGAGTMGDLGGWGTVTLVDPEPEYAFIGGRTSQSDSTTTQYLKAGYTEHSSGVSLYRSWTVPTDNVGMPQQTLFKEVMLTPGKPAVTGMNTSPVDGGGGYYGGNPEFFIDKVYDPTKSWKLNQFTSGNHYLVAYEFNVAEKQPVLITGNDANNIYPQIPIETAGVNAYYVYQEYFLCNCNERWSTDEGPDNSYISSYYASLGTTKSICRATGAFVRIVKDFLVESGAFFDFNYQLNLNISGAVQKFIVKPQGKKAVSTNWSKDDYMTGYHSLIHHGLKLITPDGGIGQNLGPGGAMTQPYGSPQAYETSNDFGESFIGAWGCPLEPSVNKDSCSAIISTDNLQFFVSPISGGASSSILTSIPNTGLMGWREAPNIHSDVSFDMRLCNIRTTGATNVVGAWPNIGDYKSETTTPGADIPHEVLFFESSKASYSNPEYIKKSRERSQIRSFEFIGETEFLETPIRSVVLGYRDASYPGYFIPYFDCLLPDKAGNVLPKLVAGEAKYSTGDYSYWYRLENNATLYFSFTETWGSPCSPEVDGC